MIAPVTIFIWRGALISIDSLTLQLGALCILLLIVCYIVQNELRNRKHSRMLLEDRTSIGALDRRVSELSELNQVSKAVTSVMEIQELYTIIMDSALRLTRAENFSLLLEKEGYLTIKASTGLDDAIVHSARVSLGEGISGWVAEKGEPLILHGPVQDSRFRKLVKNQNRITSSLSVPVKLRGRVYGVMCVSNVLKDYIFNQSDLRLLSIFSDQVAIALENNDLVLQLKSSLENCRRGQEQLIQSAKLSALGQLISGVTHELNNRLSPIIAYSELLRDQSPDGEVGRYVSTIYLSALGAKKLLKSLSSFSKERESAMAYVNLNEIMEKVLGMVAYQLKVSDIYVEKELDPSLPSTMADPFQLEEVFFNIIKNALLSIKTSSGRLRLTSTMDDGRIIFEITDNGIGIPTEALPRIFDPFFTTQEGDDGTGMGLSVCYGIIEMHGGEISVSSKEGQGTTVRIELPIKKMTDESSPAVRKSKDAPGPTSLRILVVDDEEIIRQLVMDILAKNNIIEAVGTVNEALKRIDKSDFDLIIADYRMPRVDGIQFYRRISEKKPSLKSKILFITGDPVDWRIKDFIRKTGNRCISKPFSIKELNDACKILLESSSL